MQCAEEHQLRRINNTSQGEATEGNAADLSAGVVADDILMLDQGQNLPLDKAGGYKLDFKMNGFNSSVVS